MSGYRGYRAIARSQMLVTRVTRMPNRQPVSQRTLFALIIGGLVVWALYVAIGAFLYDFDPWRAIIVLFCMGTFVGIWLLLLWSRGHNNRS
jgi:hypothetical protein